MSWVFFASFPPVMWSIGNVIDQMVARDVFHRSAFSFLIVSGLLTLPFAVGMGVFAYDSVFSLPPLTCLLLMIGGFFGFAGAWPYLIALQENDASSAIPMLQTVPVFAYLLGLAILGENLNALKLAGGALIVCGAVAFAWDPHTRRLHMRTILLMGLAALIWGSYVVWVRYWAIHVPWAAVTFWAYVCWVLMGVAGYALVRDIRRDIDDAINAGKARIFMPFILLQQAMACAADMMQTKAMSIAPTGVQVVLFNGLQPAIIMLICGFLHRFRPDLYTAIRMDRHLYVRLGIIAVMGFGLTLLLR